MSFLPVTKNEIIERGWQQPDFILISGDAYVDHPSFCGAVITRTLEAYGYKCAIISQPDWHSDTDFVKLGTPRLAFLVTAGNIDSMVNHYSVSKRRRDKDNYSDNGVMGKRPDRASIVYCQNLKRLFPNIPIILGGVEASLRRFAHYDYWDNKVRNSILIDSQVDLLVYGMGERTIIEIADSLNAQIKIEDLTYIKGTAFLKKDISQFNDYVLLPKAEDIKNNKELYCDSFIIQYHNRDSINGKMLIEEYPGWYVVCNSAQLPLTTQEMDDTYEREYMYAAHPMYNHIPAFDEVKFSLISNRGCFGSCSFCAITAHQGRIIQSRSKESIVKEAIRLTNDKDFKGYIHDVGGPTANFYHPSCDKQTEYGTCVNKECLFPKPCQNLKVDHKDYLEILNEIKSLPKVKKVFIRSGIRYDYLILDKNEEFFNSLIKNHISGQLKVAPEHISSKVLSYMHKPTRQVYERFVEKYEKKNKEFKKNQFLVPYLISSHPGSDLNEAIDLALYLKKHHLHPEQVQDFYPTPATASTCMYYTGLDPFTKKPVYVTKNPHEKAMQRALLQYANPLNYDLVKEALIITKRLDLIGDKEECLIPSYNYHKGDRKKK